MAVLNIHEREFACADGTLGSLLDRLASEQDELWPRRRWPAMRLRGAARFSWPLAFRPLHDALIEDSLDCAREAATGQAGESARWGRYVRVLRRLPRLGRLRRLGPHGLAECLQGPSWRIPSREA